MWKLIEPSPISSRWGIYIKKCISPVRICLQTRNARNASTKFRKTSESKKAEKSLEISVFFLFSCLHLNQTLIMAGIAGFEPANAGVKVLCLDRLGYIPIKKAKQPVFDARSFAYPQAAVRAVFPRYYISIFISCQVKRKPAEAFVLKKSLMPRRRTARKSGSGGV